MKTIGLIGGMSWESSAEYYRIINETVKKSMGGLHSAKCIMYSVDFGEIVEIHEDGRWDEVGDIISDIAVRLENSGADFIVICTNTMHKLADTIQAHLSIPLLHIADATGEEIAEKGLNMVGLLGTRFTMEEEFYKKRLKENFNIDTLIPSDADRAKVNTIIYDELCVGIFSDSSRNTMKTIIESLVERGAEGIILGCTEIPLLITQEEVSVPLFNTTEIHSRAAVNLALK
ncbi:MAG: aspartate/glutamate racemase family protein [Theionarchaea archaeon]|nr:aspartate/glutamate racemase family protein [Theionarchaea archaeon]